MAKVSVEYKVKLIDGHNIAKYRKKTIDIDLPKNEYGFTLVGTLHKNIIKHFEEKIIPTIKDVEYWEVLKHRVVSV